MDKKFLNSRQPTENVLDSIVAELVLDKALLHFRTETIHQKIDQSLRDKNKGEFLRLTEELKSVSTLLHQFQNKILKLKYESSN